MKRHDKKSDCAINFSLEAIGDPWSLLIVRDIVFHGKKTYGEFLTSAERIGTSVLAQRLLALENKGVIVKQLSAQDKRKEEYSLTDKGLDLIPLLLDLTVWGATYDPETGASEEWIRAIRSDRDGIASRIRRVVKDGGCVVRDYTVIARA